MSVANLEAFHTLRHRFNSKLEGLGVTKAVRRDLMGHTPTDITDDYTHSTIDQRRRAVELLCHNQGEKLVEFPANCGSGLKRTISGDAKLLRLLVAGCGIEPPTLGL
jgi:hypothetical protein